MIHPGLLQTLFRLSEGTGAAVSMSGYCRVLSEKLGGGCLPDASDGEEDTFFTVGSQEALEEFVYARLGSGLFSAIGGKLIRGEVAAAFRFDEDLDNGEDTKFLYQLFAAGAEAAVWGGIGIIIESMRKTPVEDLRRRRIGTDINARNISLPRRRQAGGPTWRRHWREPCSTMS